ncbi:MAG: hypothetical protein IKW17_00790 [Paludibacteraceae bacterium]|nr:hypothetical protein [Paludibacteraceae bacterium]
MAYNIFLTSSPIKTFNISTPFTTATLKQGSSKAQARLKQQNHHKKNRQSHQSLTDLYIKIYKKI